MVLHDVEEKKKGDTERRKPEGGWCKARGDDGRRSREAAMPLRRLSAVHYFFFTYAPCRGKVEFSRSRRKSFLISPPGVDQASDHPASHEYDHSYMHTAMYMYVCAPYGTCTYITYSRKYVCRDLFGH